MLHELADRAAAHCLDRTVAAARAWTNIDGTRKPVVALAHAPLVSAWATGYLIARVFGGLAPARA